MELFNSIIELLLAVKNVVTSLIWAIAPWWPLIAWIAFWLLAVDWEKLRGTLLKGGWIGVVLLALITALIWSCVDSGVETHAIFGLQLPNVIGKIVYTTIFAVIMILCGSVQSAGIVDPLLNFEEPSLATADAHGHDDHGHGGHDSHGHDDHGHAGHSAGHH